jgi:hypothetical protein
MNLTLEKCRRLWRQHNTWIGVVLSGALVALGYGFSLQLPFFFDDLPIMTWLRLHNWIDIWAHSSENAYYRPLAFTVYKLGLVLPMGVRQPVLRAVNLTVHWANAVLIMQLVKLCGKSAKQAVLAAALFAVFPFVYLAVPWITALSHPLVTMLTLVAVYAALRAERADCSTGLFQSALPSRSRRTTVRRVAGRSTWWGLSLLATALAPFAHESGPMCSMIVGGVVLIQCGLRSGHQRIIQMSAIRGIVLGGLLNVGGVLVRSIVPGVGEVQLAGLSDWVQNALFFFHGLLYPVAPAIGWLVNQHGAQDFTLVKVATACFGLLLVWLARRTRDWRWIACQLWWWVCGALPAAISFRFGDLYIAPRLHALSSAGVVMLWAYVIFELGKAVRHAWGRRLVWGLLAGAILIQNVAFLGRQQALFTMLDRVYDQVLEAAEEKDNAPLGFVNLPGSLAWPDKTYALILENAMFIPWYSNVGQFIEVNLGWRASDTVVFSPVLRDTELVFGSQGPGLDWDQMRQFAIDHRTVWLTRYHQDLLPPLPFRRGGLGGGTPFTLHEVGTITADDFRLAAEPLAHFEGGPMIESAAAQEVADQNPEENSWAITLTWLASGPVDGEIFVHVRDAAGNVVAQADGPALGGMVPIWLWQPGDRIRDARYVTLPPDAGPYTVQVGLYNSSGRFPALMNGARCPDDAAPVATIIP